MATTMYAWTKIRLEAVRDETDPAVILRYNTIEPGATVTPEDLGYTADSADWRELLQGGAVRPMPFPEIPATFQGSPIEYARQKVKEMEAAVAMSLAGGSYYGYSEGELLADPELMKAPEDRATEEPTGNPWD